MEGWAIMAWSDGELQMAAVVATAQEGRELQSRLNKLDVDDNYTIESIKLVNKLEAENWMQARTDENHGECDEDCKYCHPDDEDDDG